MDNATLALLIPVMVVAVVFFFVAFGQYMKHRERMAMIEKGIAPADVKQESAGRESPEAVLRGGLITAMVGLALLIGLWTIGIGPWLLGGLIPLFVGLAIIISYLLSANRADRRDAGE